MDTLIQLELKDALLNFLLRDYSKDIQRLNRLIAANGVDAKLAPNMPPIIITGNPFDLEPGRCIALIGLNPRWHNSNGSPADIDCQNVKGCIDQLREGENSALERFLQMRAPYFDENSKIYYGKYFTRLGNLIGEEQLGLSREQTAKGPSFAKSVFRKWIFKADVFPWFSTNTSDIAWDKVAQSPDDSLQQYYLLLNKFLHKIRPLWIQFNGSNSRPVVESLFGIELKEHRVSRTGRNSNLRYWSGAITLPGASKETPILVHGFGRFQGRDTYAALKAHLIEHHGLAPHFISSD